MTRSRSNQQIPALRG